MPTKSIHQTVFFDALPKEVYDLLMDDEKYSAFAGDDVEISNEINGTFEVYGGYCSGYNIELVPGQKIIQAWHFEEEGWPADHFSICTFIFEEENGKTKLTFLQSEVPSHKADALANGWEEYYWKPMKEYLEETKHA